MSRNFRLIEFSISRPRLVAWTLALLTMALGSLMVRVQVDTDPENMLAPDEPIRIFHHQIKEEFALHDLVVLGIVNEQDPDGVFNPATLAKVRTLSEFAAGLHDPRDPARRVISRDLIAPTNVDTIEQAGPGEVRFEWLMREPPADRAGSLRIRDAAMNNPLLRGTLVSGDGKAVAIYLPLATKDYSHQVRQLLLAKIAELPAGNGDEFHITGLPVAEDTFGVEMFVQMAVSAPLAMLAIFLLLFLFFRQLKIIVAPMIIAMLTVICTMGLLIGTGQTVHIMSSMIPIFLMPIAVVDSVHILSQLFDTYRRTGDRQSSIRQVMGHLYTPMLYTSLTSAAGFASLALTPIPPVRIFGIFVALGILLAWVFTILFIPAYLLLCSEKSLSGFGASHEPGSAAGSSLLSRQLRWLSGLTFHRAKLLLAIALLLAGGAAYGISQIQINDNPVKWFTPEHPIRQADRILNQHFGGTYEAFLVLEAGDRSTVAETAAALTIELEMVLTAAEAAGVRRQALDLVREATGQAAHPEQLLTHLAEQWNQRLNRASAEEYPLWTEAYDALERVDNRSRIFTQPEVLAYVAGLQEHLLRSGVVGKSNSVADIVKKVHQELYEGKQAYFRIPESAAAVAQTLISFQGSHKPDDLFHFVTPDYRKANLWVQLKSGDNKDMEQVVDLVAAYFRDQPPPVALEHQWAGLTYLNMVWQEKMVTGMLRAFLSSFAVVFLMMAVLFRSFFWGLLAMVPLSVTIALIYGLIGLTGKEYDMPVAVLSSLTLGLAVDFAIHFLQRTRETFSRVGSWPMTIREMFEEPSRAIARNAIIVAVGFTPLLAAPLVPYQTVGLFLASIMAIAGLATLLLLPALLTVFDPLPFRGLPAAPAETAEGSGSLDPDKARADNFN